MIRQTIPGWIKKRVSSGGDSEKVRILLRELSINTVCESAVCPNIYECFCKGYASFMILGNCCTRNCMFCGVSPLRKTVPPNSEEPHRIADAVKKLGMKYAVITSPTRDDLPDGGAGHFAEVTEEIRALNPGTKIELLIPDFRGNEESLKKIFLARPDIISHNIETTKALYESVRPSSNYETSINVLKTVKKNGFAAKSGFMLGLGETKEDVLSLMYELKSAGCDYLVIGQYLRPSKKAFPVREFVKEDVFRNMEEAGRRMGFKNIFAGTFYRSSYMAEKLLQ